MILHLLTDDKFTDYVIEQFSQLENSADFILISHADRIEHVHHPERVQIVNPTIKSDMMNLLKSISNYNAVVFHGLSYWWQEWLLPNIPKAVKVAWFLWGGEIYGQPDLAESFYAPISKLVYRLHRCFRKQEDYAFPKRLIMRANYCLTSEEEEVDFINNYLHTNLPHLWYTYYSIEDTVGALKEKRCEGNNIFLGNSAGIANNHFDALVQLKKVGIGDREIITPLSYGSPWERNICVKFGKCLFGIKFKSLLNFMPRDEYNAQMLSCSVMIQPHWRPNAHGNIITALWLGMRVYLSERNIEYAFFKRIGCIVYSIEKDLNRNNPDVFAPLSDGDVAINQVALQREFSKQRVQKACEDLVKELCR